MEWDFNSPLTRIPPPGGGMKIRQTDAQLAAPSITHIDQIGPFWFCVRPRIACRIRVVSEGIRSTVEHVTLAGKRGREKNPHTLHQHNRKDDVTAIGELVRLFFLRTNAVYFRCPYYTYSPCSRCTTHCIPPHLLPIDLRLGKSCNAAAASD